MDSVEVQVHASHLVLKNESRGFNETAIEANRKFQSLGNSATKDASSISIAPARLDAYKDQLACATMPIREELRQVEEMIRREMQASQTPVRDMLSYVADLGGKRLRPCLLLLAAKASGVASDDSVRLSVVVELVHMATLVHDDILDEALVRRHKETVHKKWSVPASVLVGDWLFTHAYGLANKGSSTIPGRWIADAAKQVCEGEIMQGNSVKHFELGIPEYMKLLDAKTGALCAVSCSLGAWSAGADEATCHRMQQYGLKLGTAFQIFDDWLDVWGQAESAGKTLGTDLGNFKPTLPAIRTLEKMPEQVRLAFVARLNEGDATAARELRSAMETCDASEYTLKFAKSLVVEAIGFLDNLPPNASVESLRNLALAAVQRQG
jgi:octaprenyl-diphosphate synthase